MSNEDLILDPELQVLIKNKESGWYFRERRHEQWRETYSLYRDKVIINRLTQRQSANVPLMKQSIRTLLKDVDDMPVIYFENIDNDKEAETFKNEYWRWTVKKNRMELQDIADKKQVFMFGRSFDQWQIVDGAVKMTVVDPQHMLVSRFTDPYDLNTSRFLIHTNIYVPLSTLERNKDYDQKEVKKLKDWYAGYEGIVKADDNVGMFEESQQKMADMGVTDVYSPTLGETYVELALHFVYDFREGSEEEELFLKVEAENRSLLMRKPLAGKDGVIGDTKDDYWKNHFPYNSWGDDLEKQDFWSDGIGDMLRGPNKILNSFYSQLIENRTLRNFGMQYYDATNTEFKPETFNPVPWGWYPLPGKPGDIIQRVEIPDLSEAIDEMQWIVNMAEKASGATATQQGVQTSRQVTLGEVQLALSEAKDRVKGMSKFYTPAWERRAEIFDKLVEAASDKLDAVKIYKKGRNSNKLYSREISPSDWMTKSGYQVRIWSQDEKDATDTESLQKLNAVVTIMPDNPKAREIYQRKLLEFADLTPDEVTSVMEYEQLKQDQLQQQSLVQGMMLNQMVQPQVQNQVQPTN